VRIVHTSFVEDAVVYVLRVEDVESGLQWNVRKRCVSVSTACLLRG
jgi:hypothetical protein